MESVLGSMSIGAVLTAQSLDVYARALPLCYTPPFMADSMNVCMERLAIYNCFSGFHQLKRLNHFWMTATHG